MVPAPKQVCRPREWIRRLNPHKEPPDVWLELKTSSGESSSLILGGLPKQNNKTGPYLLSCAKINSKIYYRPNANSEVLKLPREHTLRCRPGSSGADKDAKYVRNNQKIDKWDSMMLKSFCTAKNTIARVKRSCGAGRMCVRHMSDDTNNSHTEPQKIKLQRINLSSQEVGRDLKGSGKPWIQKADREKGE